MATDQPNETTDDSSVLTSLEELRRIERRRRDQERAAAEAAARSAAAERLRAEQEAHQAEVQRREAERRRAAEAELRQAEDQAAERARLAEAERRARVEAELRLEQLRQATPQRPRRRRGTLIAGGLAALTLLGGLAVVAVNHEAARDRAFEAERRKRLRLNKRSIERSRSRFEHAKRKADDLRQELDLLRGRLQQKRQAVAATAKVSRPVRAVRPARQPRRKKPPRVETTCKDPSDSLCGLERASPFAPSSKRKRR